MSAATPTAPTATLPASATQAGNVVGLMPHPEHAIEELTGPSTDGLGLLHLRPEGPGLRVTIDTVAKAKAAPEDEQPYAALGLKGDEYAKICAILGRRPTSSELAMYSVMWSEHCSYKSSRVHLKQFGEKVPDNAKDVLLIGMGENAGVVDVGNGLGGHVQGRVAQPPVVRRAAPGRRDRCRWHRPRHPHHGGAADRGDGPAAVRRRRPPRHRPGGPRHRRGHRLVRQLPRSAQHRRRGRLRPVLQLQPACECLVRRRSAR